MSDSQRDNATQRDDVAKVAIIHRYRQICADWASDQSRINELQSGISEIQNHQASLAAEANDCIAAARVFHFDLLAETNKQIEQEFRRQGAFDLIDTPPPSAPIQPPQPKSPKIKNLVLGYLEQAYPRPVKASEIRRGLTNQGIAIHDTTVP